MGIQIEAQNNEGNNTHSAIHFPIQEKPQARGLEGFGSSSSASSTHQRSFPIEHGQQEVQPSISLGRTLSKFPEDIFQRPYVNHQRREFHQEVQTPGGERNQYEGESSHYPSYRRTTEPDRAYSNSLWLTRIRSTQLSSGSHYSGTSRSVAKSHHSSQSQVDSRRRQVYKGKNKTYFSQQQKE
ncbi:hypothetical protein O181_082858 [Austropuccinia psidii MF-1]|uniref:Uncharacterized protein n=1 Tax=Austropuccinia psidii MF-1 TaxID=1389203 RepID=A0A9Q3IJ01_9BASI|nr:hypothetical protein [Austropuccinia psidii MF-1]